MGYVLEKHVSTVIKQKFEDNLDAWRAELDGFFDLMNTFSVMPSQEVLQNLASFSSRASYIRSQIMRLPENKRTTSFRTRELDPFLDECDRQFRIWSRCFAVQAQEWEISKGF